jgi:uncharacterized protein (DUF302 family)
LVSRPSPYAVAETLDRLEQVLKTKGVKVFARIDHAAEAQAAGLRLAPMQLLIFGNPKVGTPLMQAAPTLGMDLPMKALAWQDGTGQVRIGWNDPAYLVERHELDADAADKLAAVAGLIEAALR